MCSATTQHRWRYAKSSLARRKGSFLTKCFSNTSIGLSITSQATHHRYNYHDTPIKPCDQIGRQQRMTGLISLGTGTHRNDGGSGVTLDLHVFSQIVVST